MKTKTISPLRVGAKSHPGKVRSENQDRMSRFTSPFGEVFIVADGMGGHEGGALAAEMTRDGLERYLRRISPDLHVEEALQTAAQLTNAEIYQGANDGNPATRKMGATVVLAVVNGAQLWLGHAGDSRAYLFRHENLSRLTKDHSPIQKMIDHKLISEEDAREHPDASVISRAFGQEPELELEVSSPFPIERGDGLMLCTDGLCGYVGDDEIERVIGAYGDAQEITDALISVALEAGGEDNVTVQFLQFGARPKAFFKNPFKGSGPKSKEAVALEAESARLAPKDEARRHFFWSLRTALFYLAATLIVFSLGVIFGAPIVQKAKDVFSFISPTRAAPKGSVSPSPQPSSSHEPEPQGKSQKQGSSKQIEETDPSRDKLPRDPSPTPSPVTTSRPANSAHMKATRRRGEVTKKGIATNAGAITASAHPPTLKPEPDVAANKPGSKEANQNDKTAPVNNKNQPPPEPDSAKKKPSKEKQE